MIRHVPLPRLRHLRWVALAAVVPVLWACNARKLAEPIGTPSQVVKNRFQQSVNRDLDLLFLIDDSSSMAPLQQKMRDRLPDFMDVLKALPGGLPNLHVAVVSSSLGAGTFGNVPGCGPNTIGNLDGNFQHSAACTQLHAGENFLKSISGPTGARINNFDGNDITPVFSCIANLGDKGCGFEHQFEAVRLALQKATLPDGGNAGFLRSQAYLAVVMLTNEDDCSVPADSNLFDPSQLTVRDPLGGLQSYRCNEFGHKCDQPLPHTVDGLPMTMTGCKSAEDGRLVKVAEFTDFLKSLKPGHPDQILVAALAGPIEPYRVISHTFMLGNGSTEAQPQLDHSCTSGSQGTEFADPGIRIRAWADGFGSNAVVESICAPDFRPAMVKIAQTISKALGAQCVTGKIAQRDDGSPDCEVTQRSDDASGNPVDTSVPHCMAGRANAPCWELSQDTQCSGANNQLMSVCYDPTCMVKPTTRTDALVACSIEAP